MSAHASRLVHVFFGETSNHPGDSVPLIAQMQHPESSGFSPKLKSPLTVNEIQENTMGQLTVFGRTV